MPKKIRHGKSFVRTAPKSQEKHLVENAKRLYEDPFLVFPACEDDAGGNAFRKMRKKLERVHRYRDDPVRLEKFSKKRGMGGALAGTLLLAQSEKAPYLGVARFPSGNVVFAQRGRADKEHLIALQHVDDPVLRLCGIRDVALKKKLHVYSWDSGYVCTGREARPPPAFVRFIFKQLGYEHDGTGYTCPHLPRDQVTKQASVGKWYLRIFWQSADQLLAFCEECAPPSTNTVFTISKYLLEPSLSDDFAVDVIAQVAVEKESLESTETLFLSEYFSGALNDHALIQKNIKKQQETLQQEGKRLFVLDGVSYGADAHQFIDALHPNPAERIGLEYILARVEEPVVLSQATPHTVLERYWMTYGKDVVQSLLPDASLAESFANLDDTPANILKLVIECRERQRVLAQLPCYVSLPPLARFADHIARTYKTYGEKKTLVELKKRPDTPKGKSITYAFLLVLGKAEDTRWQYSPVEIEYGEYLKNYARKLLDASPEQYSTALQELLTASGSGETLGSS